jgi:hypothetical protein
VRKKATPEVESKVRAAEDTPITFGDFEAALKDIVNGGAPGPFMATANMVKGWSTEVRQFAYIYTHVCIMANARDPSMDKGQNTKTCAQGPWQLADEEHAINQPL